MPKSNDRRTLPGVVRQPVAMHSVGATLFVACDDGAVFWRHTGSTEAMKKPWAQLMPIPGTAQHTKGEP